LDLYLLVSIF